MAADKPWRPLTPWSTFYWCPFPNDPGAGLFDVAPGDCGVTFMLDLGRVTFGPEWEHTLPFLPWGGPPLDDGTIPDTLHQLTSQSTDDPEPGEISLLDGTKWHALGAGGEPHVWYGNLCQWLPLDEHLAWDAMVTLVEPWLADVLGVTASLLFGRGLLGEEPPEGWVEATVGTAVVTVDALAVNLMENFDLAPTPPGEELGPHPLQRVLDESHRLAEALGELTGLVAALDSAGLGDYASAHWTLGDFSEHYATPPFMDPVTGVPVAALDLDLVDDLTGGSESSDPGQLSACYTASLRLLTAIYDVTTFLQLDLGLAGQPDRPWVFVTAWQRLSVVYLWRYHRENAKLPFADAVALVCGDDYPPGVRYLTAFGGMAPKPPAVQLLADYRESGVLEWVLHAQQAADRHHRYDPRVDYWPLFFPGGGPP